MIYLGKQPVGLSALIGSDMDALTIFVADYLREPPTVTEGAVDQLNRRIYVV